MAIELASDNLNRTCANYKIIHTDIQMECSTEETAPRCSAGLANITSFGLQHFLYNNSKILQKVKGHLEETNFTGITVHLVLHDTSGCWIVLLDNVLTG